MRIFLGMLLTMAICYDVHADNHWSFNGFAAQGVTRSENSSFIDDANKTSLNLTELGANVRYTANDKLQVVAQVVYLDGGNRYPDGVRLDYAFLDYHLVDTNKDKINLHLGRYKNRHWLYSATRDVPQTRPSIILPQSIYFDGFRDVALRSDGLSFLGRHGLQKGELEWNWSFGKSDFSGDLTQSLLGNQARGRTEQRYVHQASVYWSTPTLNWQFGISLLDSAFEYKSRALDLLGDGESRFQRAQLSLRYSAPNFEISSEILQESVELTGAVLFASNRTGQGGYVQYQHYLNPVLSGLLRYDVYYADKDDKSGNRLSTRTGNAIPAYYGYMRTATFGLQWNMSERWRLQAEYHNVTGAGRLSPLLVPNALPQAEKRWHIFAIQFMTWF